MELNFDWSAFQRVFHSKRRTLSSRGEAAAPVFLVVENGVVLSAFSDGEDLSDWMGAEVSEVQSAFAHRSVVPFEREQVDQWLAESATLAHFIEQTEFVLAKAEAGIRAAAEGRKAPAVSPERVLAQSHFLVQGLQSWWQRVLPSAFGIYLRLEGDHPEDILMVFRRGRLERFQRGDLAGISINEQSKTPQEIVKYLSERTMVPVQGVFVSARDWSDWGPSGVPWAHVVRAMRSDQLKLVPFRWDLAAMIAARGWVGL